MGFVHADEKNCAVRNTMCGFKKKSMLIYSCWHWGDPWWTAPSPLAPVPPASLHWLHRHHVPPSTFSVWTGQACSTCCSDGRQRSPFRLGTLTLQGEKKIFFLRSFLHRRGTVAYVTVLNSSAAIWAATFRLRGYKCMRVIFVFP